MTPLPQDRASAHAAPSVGSQALPGEAPRADLVAIAAAVPTSGLREAAGGIASAAGRATTARMGARPDLEGQAAARLLLDRYTVLASDAPELFRVIRLRTKELQAWFYDRAGWQLVVTGECAYLPKIPVRAAAWQAFDTNRERPLARALDYELMAWVLWYGERKPLDHTFLVGTLATALQEEIVPFVGPDHVDWNRAEHRLSLVRAMSALEAMGAVRKLDGEAEWFARDGVDADLVYEFTPAARFIRVQPGTAWLAALAAGSLEPARMPEGARRPSLPFERTLSPRQRLYRTLLLEPALHLDTDADAFALLAQPATRLEIARDLERQLGWTLEVTNAYATLLRASREPNAQPAFPTGHILSRIALLFCQHVRDQVKRRHLDVGAHEEVLLAAAVFESELGKVKAKHDKYWGTATRQRALPGLAAEVAGVMRDWGLLTGPDAHGFLAVRPTAARYGAAYTTNDTGLTDEGDDL